MRDDTINRRAADAAIDKRDRALRKFVSWFNTYERTWSSDEYLDSGEFLDLRDVYDAAKDALK